MTFVVPSPDFPSSPIAFNLPGTREVRRRREEELARRMKDLGFQETRSPTEAPDHTATTTRRPSRARAPEPSPTYTESDDERDVVLLIEHESDVEEPPTRSASRAAMLTLFADDDDESDSESAPKLEQVAEREHGRTFSHSDVEVDVEVEVVTREAVARTKRRFSRKWIRERKGKRWTEDDFGQIISQLRMLR